MGRVFAVNLPYLDQLDRLAARAFDHHRAGGPELVGAFEEGDAFAPELLDPGIEIADAQSDMVLHLAAAAGERRLALVGVPRQYDVAELDPGPRRTEHPLAV